MHHVHRLNKKLLATAFACLVPVSFTHANGFRVPEISVAGTAASNALVANTDELGAVAYNPAAISFHDGRYVMAGVNSVSYEHTVTPTGGTRTEGTGEDRFFVPNFLVSVTGDNDVGFALLVNSPFGLETKYPDETFPGFVDLGNPQATNPDNAEPATSRIKMLNINPNVSYKIDQNSSVAVGLAFYDLIDLTFNSQAIRINGSGSGVGYNVGYLHKMDKATVGVSYRSGVTTDIDGQFDARGIGSSVIAAETKLRFPVMLQMGIHYQPTDNFGVELDLEHVGWSSFGTIRIQDSTGNILTSSANNWKDTMTYRLGFTYKISSATKLLFGYSYDETPQPDANFSARVPDADRQLFSIGASHQLSDWKLEYAYMYVNVDDRNFNSSTPLGTDANGTSAYNGEYESDVNLIGLSLSTSF